MSDKLFHFLISNVPTEMVGPLLAVLDEHQHPDFSYRRGDRIFEGSRAFRVPPAVKPPPPPKRSQKLTVQPGKLVKAKLGRPRKVRPEPAKPDPIGQAEAFLDTMERLRQAPRRPVGRPPTPGKRQLTPRVPEKNLPQPKARDLIEAALKDIPPGEIIPRKALLDVVGRAGMSNSAFDSISRNFVEEGWLSRDEPGIYRRLQRPGEPDPIQSTAKTETPPPEPDQIGGFRKLNS